MLSTSPVPDSSPPCHDNHDQNITLLRACSHAIVEKPSVKTDDRATSRDLSNEGCDEVVTLVMDSMEDTCANDGTKDICDTIMEQLDNHQSDSETDRIQYKQTVSTTQLSKT